MYKTNCSKLWIIIFCIFIINYTISSPVLGTWSQDTSPSIGLMTSKTAISAPDGTTTDDRQKIGIGEVVTCKIDPNTWTDTDCYNGTPGYNDTIGDRVWNCNDGTITPNGVTQSNETTFTASKSPNTSACVLVDVYDREAAHPEYNQYPDDYIWTYLYFDVVEPEAVFYAVYSNFDPPKSILTDWTESCGVDVEDSIMCAKSEYTVMVAPIDVSFSNIVVRENFGDGETDEWPHGEGWSSPTGNTESIEITEANYFGDTQYTGYPWYYRQLEGTSGYEDFNPNNSISIEYQNEHEDWIPFDIATAYQCFYAEDGVAQVGVVGENQQDIPWGAEMGPFIVKP